MTSFAEQQDIQRVLGRIEGKIDGIDQRLNTMDGHDEKIEARVATVERRQWYFTGAIGVSGAAVIAYIKNALNNGQL